MFREKNTVSNYIPPQWIAEALAVLKPPPRMTVSQWAERFRTLSIKETNMTGKWNNENTPYLRKIMDAFNDSDIETISFVKCTQVGGTEALLNMLGYAIDIAPAPSMIVYPNEQLCKFMSENRIKKMISATNALKSKFDENSSQLELQFDSMYLILASARSPASIGAYPIRYLFMDEIDKYPITSGKEADPRSLAKERTKTYDNNKKIINISTPTYEDGPIWTEWKSADTQYEYFVKCPHCNHEFNFKFGNLKFDRKDKETARKTAVYVCGECGGVIDDSLRNQMISCGNWEKVKDIGKRKVAFHLNVFCAPWIRLGDIAYEWMDSYKDPTKLMNFINSWLGEPFKDIEDSINAEFLMKERTGTYPEKLAPNSTCMVTGGVDVQRECFYWTVRAWLPNMASIRIANGKAFSWQEIEYVMNRNYQKINGEKLIVNLCCVDSGDQTDDVYNFCALNREWAVPVKGSSSSLNARFRRSVIDKANSKANGLSLVVVDTNYYKDMIYARLRRSEDEGGFFVGCDCSPEYAEMLCAEHKIRKKYNNRWVSVWELKAQGRDNHYFDTEVYASCASDLLGIREINVNSVKDEANSEKSNATERQSSQQDNNNFGGWFENGFAI